jgi:hypothetical protein
MHLQRGPDVLQRHLRQHRLRPLELRRVWQRLPGQPHLHQRGLRLAMMVTVLTFSLLAATEVLTSGHRAVTLEVGQRRSFRVTKLEKVTGSSGRCVEEGVDGSELDTVWLEASCAGVRTAVVWRQDGSRVQVMACAEEVEARPQSLLALRKKIQGELTTMKTVTACVRNGRVELWGWLRTAKESEHLVALSKKFGFEHVRSFVERLGSDE